MSKHPSESSRQMKLERRLVADVEDHLGVLLESQTIPLTTGGSVQVDGINEKKRILCEAFAHVGEVKSGQQRKLAQDILKLIAVERDRGRRWRKVVCVNDGPAFGLLAGRSWLAGVARLMGVEIHLGRISASSRARIAATQRRQRMVNR